MMKLDFELNVSKNWLTFDINNNTVLTIHNNYDNLKTLLDLYMKYALKSKCILDELENELDKLRGR